MKEIKTENLQIPPYWKLQAIENKYYSYQKWDIKEGDYFTICRNDEEVFKVVDIDDENFYYVLCNGIPQKPDKWDLKCSDFGEHFIHVPEWIIKDLFESTLNL